VENTLSFLGQSFFSSFRLEIAASAVKFFGAGENVAFPLEMNFDCESDLTKRGHTKKNVIFIFWVFLVAPSARFQSVPLIVVNLEERNSSPLMDDDSQHKKSRVREFFFLSLFQIFFSVVVVVAHWVVFTDREKRKIGDAVAIVEERSRLRQGPRLESCRLNAS
jgi:hypothetical protein